MSGAENQSVSLGQGRALATKLQQDIRVVLSLLVAAQSLKGRVNPRAANGLQELFDVVDVVKGMTGRISHDCKALDEFVVSQLELLQPSMKD